MRIGVVNDLSMAVVAIRRVLATAPEHQVAWVAGDGAQAVSMCAVDKPDLILMDLIMPVLDGVEATRQIMANTPCAILVVTATVDGNSPKVFEALGAGALDAVNTPVLGLNASPYANVLLAKIDMLGKLMSGVRRTKKPASPPVEPKTGPVQLEPAAVQGDFLLAIGASAGGPMALSKVLGSLPVDFPAAVIIIQHVDPQFAQGLAEWLQHHSVLPVRLAREGDQPRMGTVLVAGTGDHLVFVNSRSLGYTSRPTDEVYRPSVDVFFESVVKHWRGKTIGVLLTGMGRDGARGLKMLRNAGCHTIAQDRATSVVYGMPKAAVALAAAVEILPLEEIGPALKNIYIPPSLRKAGLN